MDNNQTPPPPAGGQPSMPGTSQGSGNEKLAAILAYIIFFLPLLIARNSKFAMYHANQGLLLLIFFVAINIIAIIPILGWLVLFVGWIFGVVILVLGMVNAAAGKMKPLPWIGKFTLLQ